MTILKLHKILTGLIKDGHGRKLVCVNTLRITHPLESDGCTIIPITDAEIDTHLMLDDDGGMKELSDGTISTRTALVIVAEC